VERARVGRREMRRVGRCMVRGGFALGFAND
jgi:hypothetical protein